MTATLKWRLAQPRQSSGFGISLMRKRFSLHGFLQSCGTVQYAALEAGAYMQIHDVVDLNIAIISASHRSGSQSLRIAEALRDQFLLGNADVIDLFDENLPLWDGEQATMASNEVASVKARVKAADGLVMVIPEWHGMVPAGLKNLLLWLGADELAHKPVLLVGISVSSGGAFVVSEMRASGYKNSRMLYLPEHLLLRNVADLWQQEDAEADAYISARTRYCVDQLLVYCSAMRPMRESLCEGLAEYPNGMS